MDKRKRSSITRKQNNDIDMADESNSNSNLNQDQEKSDSSTSRNSTKRSKTPTFATQLSTSSNTSSNGSIGCSSGSESLSKCGNENVDTLSNSSSSSSKSSINSKISKNSKKLSNKNSLEPSSSDNDDLKKVNSQETNEPLLNQTKKNIKTLKNNTSQLDVIKEDEISQSSNNKSKSSIIIEHAPAKNEQDITEEGNNTNSSDSNNLDETNKANNENEDSSDQNEPKKKRRRRGSLMAQEHQLNSAEILATNLFIYTWPLPDESEENNKTLNPNPLYDSDNSYVLQEQFSEYLGVKSFKRKYPDIFRRLTEVEERRYLKDNKIVTETQCDLGLSALRLSECLDIMANEYPDKYTELTSYLAEKRRKSIAAKQLAKQDAQIASAPKPGRPLLTEQEKLREQIKKAMKSASSYNSMLQKEKKEERYSFFDLQTMRIQQPLKKQNLNLNVSNPNGFYPVSLLQGQFHHHYKRYTSEQLKYMPLDTVINSIPTPTPYLYDEWKKKEEKRALNGDKNMNDSSDDERLFGKSLSNGIVEKTPQQFIPTTNISLSNKISTLLSSANTNSNTIRITASAAPTVAKLISANNNTNIAHQSPTNAKLTPVIKQSDVNKTIIGKSSAQDNMIICSSCSRSSHPDSLELNPDIVDWEYIKSYDWQCMECKKCSICNNPHDEDKMMFCDRCDRGFHTYCVGVKVVPSGIWLCKTCSNDRRSSISQDNINNKSQVFTSPEGKTVGRRGRPPGSLNKPKDPNSPKKTPKINKMMNSYDMNMSGNLSRMDDDSHDTSQFNQELSFYH